MKLLFLSIIPQLVSLAFLILVSISAPTLKNIYLAQTDDGTTFGIFGYCLSDSKCSPISLNTSVSKFISSKVLSSHIVDKLMPYFIVAPISAGVTFLSILFNLLAAVSVRKLASSILFLSVSLTITVLAFLTSAFVCIITFLIYYPHVHWLAWCLIPTAVINLGAIVFNALAFKLSTASDEALSSDKNESDVKDEINYDNSLTFDKDNRFEFRQDLHNTQDIPSIHENNYKFSQLIKDSEESSVSEFENEKGESAIVSQQETEVARSSSSKVSLKVPSITNPYANDASSLNDYSSFDDNRLNDAENISFNSSSSNFTSISQRPINANYYAGANAKPRIPLGNNQNNHQYNVQQGNLHQQGFQQRQINNFQNQMSSMPNQNKSMYLRKPKPYMVMGKPKPNMINNHNNNYNPYLPQTNYQMNAVNRNYPQQYTPHQVNQFNSSIPPNSNYNQQTGFVPMKYKGRTKMNFPPASAQNDGPYSGFI